ncbi:hypothetical protein [Streptomyces sp. NPDC059564]|uniref:hypothetical protein n=1 Tax=Streptomyces sp. NPDC059564 TaxID=3346865 RepID=UPI00367CA77E
MTIHDGPPPLPGERRDRLVEAVPGGAKTATARPPHAYGPEGGPLPGPGGHAAPVECARQHRLSWK